MACFYKSKTCKKQPSELGVYGELERLLKRVIEVAKVRGYQQLNLETGSMAYFEPARNLYSKFGFKYCGHFGDYVEDPNNVFMQLVLK